MTMPERVVFDCNVFFQALTSPFGPAARLLELASSRDILLFVSVYTQLSIRTPPEALFLFAPPSFSE